MKRIIIFALAAVMVLGAVGAAQAIDIKIKGSWDFAFLWTDGTTDGGVVRGNKKEQREDDRFNAVQRIRTQIDFIASENLQGVLMFEIGNIDWGRGGTSGPGSGGQLDADGVNIETRRAYLDWIVPNSDLAIRMGIQALNLPMANDYSNPVFSADVAGIVTNYQITDMFALTAFWVRPFDSTWNDTNRAARYDEADFFGLMAPITGEGWTLTPWAMYGNIGNAAGMLDYMGFDTSDSGSADRANAWWGGLSAEVAVFDPLTFGFDVMYGSMGRIETDTIQFDIGTETEIKQKGWFAAAALNYTMDWGTPGLFGWWSTGDDYDDIRDGEYGRMPVIGTDDGFGPTSFGFPGANSPVGDTAVNLTGAGTWGVGIQLADLTFVENLTHTLRFAYYRGTNDHDIVKNGYDPVLNGEAVYLTDKDSVYEVNFDHAYSIYDNLTAYLELGYIHLDLKNYENRPDEAGNAWKAQVVFNYSF